MIAEVIAAFLGGLSDALGHAQQVLMQLEHSLHIGTRQVDHVQLADLALLHKVGGDQTVQDLIPPGQPIEGLDVPREADRLALLRFARDCRGCCLRCVAVDRPERRCRGSR